MVSRQSTIKFSIIPGSFRSVAIVGAVNVRCVGEPVFEQRKDLSVRDGLAVKFLVCKDTAHV